MRLYLKDGVRFDGIHSKVIAALSVACGVYESEGQDRLVITSANDSKHKAGSKHYTGDAVDLRVWGFSDEQRARVRDRIANACGRDFDVLDEGDHIHVEYDPKPR